MRVTLLSSNYYYLYVWFYFPKLKMHLRPFWDSPWISKLTCHGWIFGISLCSAEQDQTLRWCQWPIWRPKSCLFALLLVYKHSCSSVQGLPTFVHSFFCTWCNTQTFYVSEKRQLSVRIQGVLFWVFASSFFCHIEFEWICPLMLLVSSSSGTVCLLMWTVSHMSCLQLSERTSSMSVLLPWSF